MYYIIAILAALLLSAFQYLYKRKALWLFILRFLTYTTILFLLINPEIEKKTEQITKPDLYVLADNTLSIKSQKAGDQIIETIKKVNSPALQDKYKLHFFKFDSVLSKLDSLQFNAGQTDIAKALSELSFLHQGQQPAAVLLLSDGQANSGQNYVYQTLSKNLHIYPLIVGDTTTYNDLKIDLLNVNPYTYQENRFPVELFVSGQINQPVTAVVKIMEGKQTLFKKNIRLTPGKSTARIALKLKAGKKGLHRYKAVISGIKQEKNTYNNFWYFNVEVLDNAKKILIVSNIIHPDIGAIKRSLKQHKYIQIEVKSPKEAIANLADYKSLILYQPGKDFDHLMTRIKIKHKPWLIITGKHTDWGFINGQKLFFNKQPARSFEAFFPVKNTTFSLFKLPELDLKDLPPLYDLYGKVSLSGATDIAYFSKLNGLETRQPLIAFNTQDKQAVFLGENIWQWAMQAGLHRQKTAFDQLIFQTIQYLSLQDSFERLKINFKKQYFQGTPIKITAQFLNKNLEVDINQNPVLTLIKANKTDKFPMTLNGDIYQADLSKLPAGDYKFVVQNKDKSLKKSGYFKILPYSLERINASANITDLKELARKTGGQWYFDNNQMIKDLSQTKAYPASLTYETKKSPLIDYRWLLFLLVFFLSLEWFIKKLQGSL